MSINSTYSSNRLRFGGLATGLDTDSIVRDLMKIEQMKVDKLKQERQVLEWQKEDYRKITNLLRSFYDDYFDIVYSKTNMTSANTYNTIKVQSSDERYLTATASAGAYAADKTITRIITAKAAYAEGAAASAKIQSAAFTADEGGKFDINLSGQSLVITVDGATRMINFDEDSIFDSLTGTETSLVEVFQEKLNQAFGSNRVTVGFLKETVDGKEEYRLHLHAEGSTITINNYINPQETTDLGFRINQSNRVNLDSTLLGLKDHFNTPLNFQTDEEGNEVVNFTINGVEFTFKSNDTLRTVINTINNSQAGVTVTYSSLTDRFTLTNKNTGAANTLTFSDAKSVDNPEGSNFLEALGFDPSRAEDGFKREDGRDATIVIDGVTVQRSTNNFTIDGITYNLTRDFEAVEGEVEAITLAMTQDVDQAFENIKTFVEAYNKVIETINEALSQERFRDYPPLTDEQKEAMTDKEIELWEEKARSGLLQRDPILQNIVYSIRRALVEPIKNVSINLSSIGITTGSYTEGGKLHIDETKLKNALRERGDEVMRLFTSRSEISYSPDNTREERTQRYEESGLIHRLSDIIQDNIRTRRDKDGRKGVLLEKAGIVGDASETVNLMDERLREMNRRIDDALDRMVRTEERYWAQFTALETALQRMMSQSMWLAQQFGGGMY
ncbi:MAG: flagellar filament capping protein FliD [Caldicoprobacterales bacterium]|jgi:flagellar hook-associated protein 2